VTDDAAASRVHRLSRKILRLGKATKEKRRTRVLSIGTHARTHTRGVSKYVDYTRDDYASKRTTLLRRNSLIIPFTALHIAHATSFPRFPRRGVTRRGRCETREATPLVWHAEIQPAEFAIVGDFSLRAVRRKLFSKLYARARARVYSHFNVAVIRAGSAGPRNARTGEFHGDSRFAGATACSVHL